MYVGQRVRMVSETSIDESHEGVITALEGQPWPDEDHQAEIPVPLGRVAIREDDSHYSLHWSLARVTPIAIPLCGNCEFALEEQAEDYLCQDCRMKLAL